VFDVAREEVVKKVALVVFLSLTLSHSLLFVIIGNYQSFLIKTLDVRGASQRLITWLVVSVSVQRLLLGGVRGPVPLEEATLKQSNKKTPRQYLYKQGQIFLFDYICCVVFPNDLKA
jgi:hypothetical protein